MIKKQPISVINTTLLIAALSLSSCTALFDDKPKPKIVHAKPQPPQNTVDGDVFIENVSLSRLALIARPDDTDAIASNLATIKSYANQQPKHKHAKTQSVTLAIIDYKLSNDGTLRQVIAPVPDANNRFALLQGVMEKLSSLPVTLHNIHLVSTTITPDKSQIPPSDSAQIAAALDQQQTTILQPSVSLKLLDDINTQLALMDFFTRHHYQDAAYLTLDNVKRMLANAAQNKTIDEAKLKVLSQKLETQESTLKIELPYKF